VFTDASKADPSLCSGLTTLLGVLDFIDAGAAESVNAGDYKRLFLVDVHCLAELSSASGGSRMAGRPRRSIHRSTSRRPPVTGEKLLAGAVTVVAGATRGAGRGIARALGEAGATVYCTGRSVRGNRSPYNRPETVDETAEMISAAGGSAMALRVDHTVEEEVEALFERVDRECGRIDMLVNSIAGEDPLMAQWCSFWKTDLKNAEAALRQSLLSHIITAKHAAPYMIRNRRGLIVEVTENDVLSAGGNPVTQTVKLALKGLALNMAAELRPHGVAAVAVTPGVSQVGDDARAIRRHRGDLARRREKRPELPGIRVAEVRGSRRCSIGRRPRDPGPHGTAFQLLGTRA
jgi:NAD(P)-dependent dehydrogenase (short-subunit alcohol dehydrogenase family)